MADARHARAHFRLATKFVCYHEKEAEGSTFDSEATVGVLFQECTHELLNWLRPEQNKASLSMSFEEAFAEYCGAVRKTGKCEKEEILTAEPARLRAVLEERAKLSDWERILLALRNGWWR